jgi:excinuclease ABC subunit A
MARAIEVVGARENNLRDVRVEIPRDSLVVVTGVSGSGKSSLAFDTVYAEGQRRLLASMSSFAKRFISQLKKPDVDFVNGLSPVISIDQKSVGSNPRSTVGTMTDISDYLRMLFATVGQPHCPLCAARVPVRSPQQMLERMLSLPAGARVEVRAPVFRPHGEDHAFLFEQIRTNGYRRARIDGKEQDLGKEFEVDEETEHRVEAVIDEFVIEPGIDKQVLASLEHGQKLGNGFLSFHILGGADAKKARAFHDGFGCTEHRIVSGTLNHWDFTFNDPAGACPTCVGLGTSKRVHAKLLVPDPKRSLADGAIVKEAFNNDKNAWGGRWLYTLSRKYGFSLDVPFAKLSPAAVDVIFHGTKGEKLTVEVPPGARQGEQYAGKQLPFRGVVAQLEHHYHWYRKQGAANTGIEEWLKKVMVDVACPECGGARLKKARQLVRVSGKNLHEVGELHLADLAKFLDAIEPPPGSQLVYRTILKEVQTRLDLLVQIGLDYLSLNRESGTLSGGESQRIRLSSQIGSGLMGMLYVLDEPSIGLHPKDNDRMIQTLKRLRDIGNTVIVVEHDEDTIRSADHVIEIGPGPGVHGGTVVVSGPIGKILDAPESITGRYLRGDLTIPVPPERRKAQRALKVVGARHNNLRDLTVEIPLGVFTCVTGASGSGKSSLVHEILFKKLYSLKVDSRVMPGDHDRLDGHEAVDQVIDIDQTPIGRTPRSNPATYVGFYDHIRKFFADSPQAKKRGFDASRFSFNVKGGRCEECAGDGRIVTQLSFMPDVEVVCPMCKGSRYRHETLEIAIRGKNIHDILEMSIEEGLAFFATEPAIHRRLEVLEELGLGYLKIGHPSTILSGGEAQRVKLSSELGKLVRGQHNVYIFDEPTTGLHFADIARLLACLNRLVERGHSVIVIEHNLDVIKCADHVIDLGPEGGHRGGELLAAGTPEDVAASARSHTGRYLKKVLATSASARSGSRRPSTPARRRSSGS